jgi:hypothetical protein
MNTKGITRQPENHCGGVSPARIFSPFSFRSWSPRSCRRTVYQIKRFDYKETTHRSAVNFVVSSYLFFEWQFFFPNLNIGSVLECRRHARGLLACFRTSPWILSSICTRRLVSALLLLIHMGEGSMRSSWIGLSNVVGRVTKSLVFHTTNFHRLRDFLNALSVRGGSIFEKMVYSCGVLLSWEMHCKLWIWLDFEVCFQIK